VKARLSTAGGARGNPGPAAYGYVLEADDGTVLDEQRVTGGPQRLDPGGHQADAVLVVLDLPGKANDHFRF